MCVNQVIPRKIVICLDGTWESPAEKSNVYKFSRLLTEGEVTDNKGIVWEQVCKYYCGLGTVGFRVLGGAFGYGISEQIKQAYECICKNYRDSKDEIWLLGFSRGAYAIRSLVGMINNVGLLPQTLLSKTNQAYSIYRNQGQDQQPNGICAVKFRTENLCQIPSIHFMGCYDTVGSLGVPVLPWYLGGPILYNLFDGLHSFHDTMLPPIVKHAYHALSIHEQRAWFCPTLMHFSDKKNRYEQVLEQVWFPGMHTDVGGKQTTKHSRNIISCHSLHWMTLKAYNLGLIFNNGAISSAPNCAHCKFLSEDSYLSALVYRIEPRKDRTIPKDETTRIYDPKTQIYLQGQFETFLSAPELGGFKSKTLELYYKNCLEQSLLGSE
ncbi:hypothetical protein BY458DRAFT_556804 [Sporodiniella umbellata]|nr:hypothetical protein BY458DRAFT_556804 [Sporodiniella umbellata]